jgi:hypothetical protein
MRSQNKFKMLVVLSLAAAAALVLEPSRAEAQNNILVNTNFGDNTGEAVAEHWTYFDDPTVPSSTHDYWIGGPPTGGFYATPLSGTQYWKEWGAGYFPATNNVSGIYQTFGSAPGSVYQASGWFYTSTKDELGADNYVWMDVSFLGSGNNLLALYTSAYFSFNTGEDQWFQFDVTNACKLSSPVSTGDFYFTNYAISGSVSQLVAPPGTTQVRYRFAILQANKEGGSCYFDDPALIQESGPVAPVIGNVFPQDMIFVPPSNGLTFDVSSPIGTTIDSNAIHVVLNGVDVSSNLEITGSSSNKTVAYYGLQSNTVYTATISAIDASNLFVNASNYFETTWVGIPPILYLWEAEDFDFNSGMFINFPDLCNAPGDPNCYFGTVGTPGIDEQADGESISHLYRTNDEMNIDVSGDYLRPNLYLADRTDYEINPYDTDEWMNYTRDFTNGVYWIIGRLATDITLSGTLTMSVVNSDSTLTPLGTFTIAPHGLGYTTFENIFLLDANGNKVNVTLNGKTTLQVQTAGNLLPNFFALVVATPDQPILSGMYPTGTQPFEYTNALTFTVNTLGSTFPANGINVNLDGFNVSSDLVITGPSSNETVVYPSLLLNARHIAIISATNSLGHGILVTNEFDTFSQSNYMVQASDFDYDGGQYIPADEWTPNAYEGYEATTNIDFEHTFVTGEEYNYRPDGIPQEHGSDFLTAIFVNYGGVEWDLGWFGIGDWANYTGDYPAGSYFVYVRTAGLGSNSMYLEQVVSGAGTTNQVVRKLGDWNTVGVDNSTYAWVPLTDDGSVAPIVVTLGGVETLRLTTTTGDCYPNYFMFVPASGIKVLAAREGANASISFPTQSGVVYRVFYRNAVGTGTWTLLTSVLGNGSVEPVSVAAGSGTRFYMVVAP